jgi:hypothetical protein
VEALVCAAVVAGRLQTAADIVRSQGALAGRPLEGDDYAVLDGFLGGSDGADGKKAVAALRKSLDGSAVGAARDAATAAGAPSV